MCPRSTPHPALHSKSRSLNHGVKEVDVLPLRLLRRVSRPTPTYSKKSLSKFPTTTGTAFMTLTDRRQPW